MKTLRFKQMLIAMALVGTQISAPFAYAQKQKAAKPSKKEEAEAADVVAKAEGAGPVLSLDAFLGQVRTQNQGFVASEKASEGAELRSDEYKLLTRPNLIGSANYIDDKTPPASGFEAPEKRTTSYSLGVSQNTDFGLQASLTYNINKAESLGLPPTAQQLGIPTTLYTNGPVLQLNQSLLRNWLGRETRATQQQQSAQVEATKYTESFRQTQILAEAETAYWRLALAREAVQANQENLERSKRMAEYNSRQQRLGLGDRSDFLQANSAVLARGLELQAALDEEEAASRAFNTARGVDSNTVSETMASFEPKVVTQLQIPQRVQFRDDVKAAEQQKRLAEAVAQLGVERNKPTLTVNGTLALNGRDAAFSPATRESVSTDFPRYVVGVSLNMPLDMGTLKRDREGYRAEAAAADTNFQRRVYETERLWTDLTSRFKDSLTRLQLAVDIEKAQREKVEYERLRHRRGRTTTYQVLQFEQDFANAQLARIRAQADILGVYAQLKTFTGGRQ